ncbi:MAG: hypothetical protein Q9222_001788 [Ikaeria aurantiellina]
MPGPVQGHSGLRYSLQGMSPPSAVQATSGITADFVVDRVRRLESHHGAYFAFQLNKPVSVRIYDPADRGQHIECTCEEFQSSQAICVHIYWLYDGLNAALYGPLVSGMQIIDRAGIISQISELYTRISSQLTTLPTTLNAAHDEVVSDTDDPTEVPRSPASTNTRPEQVRDMLSVFDLIALPEDYGRNFDSSPTSDASNKLYVPSNLPATIYRLAVQDEGVFRKLRRVISHDICATASFSKSRAKAREAFAALDVFLETGPSEGQQRNTQDIPRCARVLRNIVHQICGARDVRTSSGPLSASVVTKVAEILVEILQEVCNRNEDVYYRISWERETSDNEPARDRNLYSYLIGHPPRFSSSAPSWMRETFVIDRLRQLPTNEWRHLIERLTSILDQMREHLSEEDDPPLAYTKLERMIQEYTTEAFEPSSSSVQRRPTLGDQRESQRRRFE